MADLRTDYKDDLLDTFVNTKRKYRMETNDDGTVSFVDETVYTQNGDTFGASEVNQIHAAVNLVNDSLNVDFTNSTATSINELLQYIADKFFGKIMYLLQNGVANTGLVSFVDTSYSLPDRSDYSHVSTITTYSDGVAVVKLSGTENLSSGSWFSDNAFDLTGKTYLHITFKNFVMTNGNWSCFYGVTPTKANNFTPSSLYSIAPTNNETTVTLDISSVSGEQYIFICLGGGGNYASIKDIWLE